MTLLKEVPVFLNAFYGGTGSSSEIADAGKETPYSLKMWWLQQPLGSFSAMFNSEL